MWHVTENMSPLLLLSLLRYIEMTSELITFYHLRCHSSSIALIFFNFSNRNLFHYSYFFNIWTWPFENRLTRFVGQFSLATLLHMKIYLWYFSIFPVRIYFITPTSSIFEHGNLRTDWPDSSDNFLWQHCCICLAQRQRLNASVT